MDEKLYSEKEVSEIINRAADLQSRLSPGSGKKSGVAESELLQMARELGIDEQYVRRAMQAGATAEGGSSGFWGGELVLRWDTSVEGEPNRDLIEQMAAELAMRSSSNHRFPITQVGNTYLLKLMGNLLNVVIRSENGSTQIRAEGRAWVPLLVLGIQVVVWSALTAGAVLSGTMASDTGMITLAAILLGGYGVIRWLTGQQNRMLRRAYQRVLDDVATMIQRSEDGDAIERKEPDSG